MGLSGELVEHSVLSERQVESLLSYLRVAAGQMKLKEAAAQRSTRPVTIGSYYRTVQQARRKVKASVVTVVVAVGIGLIKAEDVRRLFDLVGKGSVELIDEDRNRFAKVLRTLVDEIVM